MSKPLKPRRGTTAQHASFIGEAHEVTYDTDKQTLVCHDGLTAGGFPLARADEVAAKDAAQDAAISTAQSSADAAQSSIAEEKQLLEAQIQQAMPAGTVIAFAANSTPDGFLLCNGAAVSRTTYAKLFEAIGTTYGAGDGSTTFNLPNLTDRFIQGSGTAGEYREAGLPAIYGGLEGLVVRGDLVATGAFFNNGYNVYDITGGYAGRVYKAGFNANDANALYGASTTVQPPALTMRYYIKY